MVRVLIFAIALLTTLSAASSALAGSSKTTKGMPSQDEIVAGIRDGFSSGTVPTAAQLQDTVWNCQVVDARQDIFNVVRHDGQFNFIQIGHLYQNAAVYLSPPWRLTATSFSSDSFGEIDPNVDPAITQFARISARGSLIVEYCTSDTATAAVSAAAIGDTSLFAYRYSICQRAP